MRETRASRALLTLYLGLEQRLHAQPAAPSRLAGLLREKLGDNLNEDADADEQVMGSPLAILSEGNANSLAPALLESRFLTSSGGVRPSTDA